MNKLSMDYVVNNISLPFNASFEEAFSVARKKLKSIGIRCNGAKCSIYRRSTDARKKNDIRFVYSVRVSGCDPTSDQQRLQANGITVDAVSNPEITFGEDLQDNPVVIVGTGPCGMFCALMLAENGFKTVLLERGADVKKRTEDIKKFVESRRLDVNSNIQFGAGGAGTFSDGKLITRINDSLSSFVLKKLVEFGASEEILYVARPHIGTDVLSLVVDRILARITELGGKILYNTTFLGYLDNGPRIKEVITSNGSIACSDLVLAIGHSSRDTYHHLIERGISVEAKQFSVGMRIEHPVTLIDTAMYGEFAGNSLLGHAEYNLSYNTKKRGVYTFCMCPGGTVVPATSEEFGVVTNGMSYNARDGKNSNSAICCTVFKEDFGGSALQAMEFQRRIEKNAFIAGGSNYSAPIITVGDFLNGSLKSTPSDVIPTYMDGVGIKLADPNEYLPSFVTESIKNAISDFDKKIHGFAHSSAILTGAETRTSAPVRILRNNDTGLALGFTNLYPSGEGAGYAGGITSAAIDGIKTALHIMKKYKKQ